jgi:hypothetical protein
MGQRIVGATAIWGLAAALAVARNPRREELGASAANQITGLFLKVGVSHVGVRNAVFVAVP